MEKINTYILLLEINTKYKFRRLKEKKPAHIHGVLRTVLLLAPMLRQLYSQFIVSIVYFGMGILRIMEIHC